MYLLKNTVTFNVNEGSIHTHSMTLNTSSTYPTQKEFNNNLCIPKENSSEIDNFEGSLVSSTLTFPPKTVYLIIWYLRLIDNQCLQILHQNLENTGSWNNSKQGLIGVVSTSHFHKKKQRKNVQQW